MNMRMVVMEGTLLTMTLAVCRLMFDWTGGDGNKFSVAMMFGLVIYCRAVRLLASY